MKTDCAWEKYTKKQLKDVETLSTGYRAFLDAGKTERECVSQIVNTIEEKGYVELAKVIAQGTNSRQAIKYMPLIWKKQSFCFRLAVLR